MNVNLRINIHNIHIYLSFVNAPFLALSFGRRKKKTVQSRKDIVYGTEHTQMMGLHFYNRHTQIYGWKNIYLQQINISLVQQWQTLTFC